VCGLLQDSPSVAQSDELPFPAVAGRTLALQLPTPVVAVLRLDPAAPASQLRGSPRALVTLATKWYTICGAGDQAETLGGLHPEHL
jgi:hypothetical protein